MINRNSLDRFDLGRKLAILGARGLLGLGLGLVLSMGGLAIAWGLFIFSSSHDRTLFMAMSMVGAGIGASVGVNIAWMKMDRQQLIAVLLALLLCLAGGIIGGMLGYQYGANREIDCCAEPRTTPFTYTAFGATIGANVIMYVVAALAAVARTLRGNQGAVPERR